MRNKFIDGVFEATNQEEPFVYLEKKFGKLSEKTLKENLIQFGVLPEVFKHDSSEEKNWAKLSDIILAQALSYLDIPSEVLRTRGNSADVFGRSKKYTIIGDAKTFRLSRTAKNQKDFKIKALDDWRRENTYAILVSPLSQYPTTNSQIYFQAIDKNVTLLSYLHLKLLLDFGIKNDKLEKLWCVGRALKTETKAADHAKARPYWQKVNETVCEIANVGMEKILEYKDAEIQITRDLGHEGIRYWETKIEECKQLPKAEAIRRLIKAEKFESKIVTIKKAIRFEEVAV